MFYNLDTFSGNCGMAVIYGFHGEKRPTNTAIREKIQAELGDGHISIVAFSGNEIQEKDKWGPKQFADWLKNQGEKVTKTAKVLNHGTGRLIQAFYWSPSLKFRKKYGMGIFDEDLF